jgi:four helix bundle protein
MKRMGPIGHIGPMSEPFIPPHGGYAGLLAYQKALVVFQGTARFCARFLEKRDRTVDQMIQAARSGKQNIVEGSKVSGTSKEAEIKLLNVARASLEELLEDYRDLVRVRKAGLWPKDSREALFVRKLGAQKDMSYKAYETYIETRSPEVVANILICLPARPAHPHARESICQRRRLARTHDSSALDGAGEAKEPLRFEN